MDVLQDFTEMATGFADISTLATALGVGETRQASQDTQDTGWSSAKTIAVAVSCGLIALAVVLVTAARVYVGLKGRKLEGQSAVRQDHAYHGHGLDHSHNRGRDFIGTTPAAEDPSLPSPTSARTHANYLRVLSLGFLPKPSLVNRSDPVSDVEQARDRNDGEPREAIHLKVFDNRAAPSYPSRPAHCRSKLSNVTRSNSLKRLSYGIRRVTDPIRNRSPSISTTTRNSPQSSLNHQSDVASEIPSYYTSPSSPSSVSYSFASDSSSLPPSLSSSSSSSSSLSSRARRSDAASSNMSNSAASEIGAYAAMLGSDISTSGKHQRGRPVRSEGGREAQLKLLQSLSSLDSQAIEDADDEISTRMDLDNQQQHSHGMPLPAIPDMLPTEPRHRIARVPRSILRYPSARPNTSPAPQYHYPRGLGIEIPASSRTEKISNLKSSPKHIARTYDPETAAAAAAASSSSKSYAPRWVTKPLQDYDATEHIDPSSPLSSRRPSNLVSTRKVVRFGEDTVRRVSLGSPVELGGSTSNSSSDDQGDSWLSVDSVERDVEGNIAKAGKVQSEDRARAAVDLSSESQDVVVEPARDQSDTANQVKLVKVGNDKEECHTGTSAGLHSGRNYNQEDLRRDEKSEDGESEEGEGSEEEEDDDSDLEALTPYDETALSTSTTLHCASAVSLQSVDVAKGVGAVGGVSNNGGGNIGSAGSVGNGSSGSNGINKMVARTVLIVPAS